MSEASPPRPRPLDLSIPTDADGAPIYDEEAWNDFLSWYATELLGIADVCREPACARGGHCAFPGAPCITRHLPAVEPVMDAVGLLVRARFRFIEEVRAEAADEAGASGGRPRIGRRKRR